MQFIPSTVAALVISSFHTGISRMQPVHPSTNKVKAERTRQSWAKKTQKPEKVESEGPVERSQCHAILRKWRQKLAEFRKKAVIMLCHFGARQRLQHLADSSKAHFATLHSYLTLCPLQSLNMPIYVPCMLKAYSAHVYTYYTNLIV